MTSKRVGRGKLVYSISRTRENNNWVDRSFVLIENVLKKIWGHKFRLLIMFLIMKKILDETTNFYSHMTWCSDYDNN